MEKFFNLNQRKTTVKTDFFAGMTVFILMVYTLMVNANMFADPFGDGANPLGDRSTVRYYASFDPLMIYG